MPVPTAITDLSTTAASNSPAGADSVGPDLDGYLRAHAKFIADLHVGELTLTNKTLTSPVINSPTGIVKGDVGLGNVDNTSDATKNAAVATLTNKTLTSPTINSATIDSPTITGTVTGGGASETSAGLVELASRAEVAGTHTTGTITSGTAALTVASGTGINDGDYAVGEGITPGTTVSSGGGTTSITLSANANATLSSNPVSFYRADRACSPGVIAGQLARAWVNFNGSGTVDIRAAYNVTSITDNASGNFTINFTTAMPDANYAFTMNVQSSSTSNVHTAYVDFDNDPTDSTLRINTAFSNSATEGLDDKRRISVIIFR